MDLNEIFDETLASELIKALQNGNDFSYAKDGLSIKANMDEGTINIACSYSTQEDVNQELRKDFYKFCDEMDEDLFLEVCESLDDLAKVNEMIEGDKVDEGIKIFMDALKTIVVNKVASYNKKIDLISKNLESIKQERNALLKYME